MSKTFTRQSLETLLGIKSPLLMLDGLVVDGDAMSARGVKMVSVNEAVFTGHFPVQPVLPGVLQVAGMVQAAKAILLATGVDGRLAVCGFRKVKFRKPVQPGMVLDSETSLMQRNEDGSWDFQVKNTVAGDLASSGIVTLAAKPDEWFEPKLNFDRTSPLSEKMMGELADTTVLTKYLPHRFPFMLIDGAYNLGQGNECVGFKNVSGDDALVQAVASRQYPGYLQIETAAQMGCAHILSQPGYQGKLGFFMSIDNAVFYRPVFAGEQLHIYMACDFGGRYGTASGKLYVASELVAEGALKFAIVDPQ